MAVSISLQEAQKIINALNEALRKGHPYRGDRVTKSAKQMAAYSLGISAHKLGERLKAIKKYHGLEPDRSLETVHDPSEIPEGFSVSRTTTLYDCDGNEKMRWVQLRADREQLEMAQREAIEGLLERVPKLKPLKPPKKTNEDLMAVYLVGDHHMGMLSWAEETGADYDLQISEDLLHGAMKHLSEKVEPADKAALLFLGDFMHYDNFETLTPQNKNLLDADGRFPKMVRAVVRAMKNAATLALKRHKELLIIVEPGNHDPSSSIFLMELLTALFSDDPRVTVDNSPTKFHYFRWGKCLLGTHHGDKKIKFQDLPLIMATDVPVEWGKSEYRFIYTGHVHHDHVMAKDHMGCRIESVRVLAAPDAYAVNSGYRSGRDMKAVVFHKEYGRVQETIVNPAMLL
jgi:hypothetical protein